jgi:hypothetical protein
MRSARPSGLASCGRNSLRGVKIRCAFPKNQDLQVGRDFWHPTRPGSRLRREEDPEGPPLQAVLVRPAPALRAQPRRHLPRLWRPEEAEASEPVPGVRKLAIAGERAVRGRRWADKGRPRAARCLR